jgi:hypothetical protein
MVEQSKASTALVNVALARNQHTRHDRPKKRRLDEQAPW